MKTITTLIFVLFIAVTTQAQAANKEVQVEPIEMSIVNTIEQNDITLKSTIEVARIYHRTNTRVKKALSFTTKRNKAKMA